MKKIFFLGLLLVWAVLEGRAFAWSDHWRITEHAIAELPQIKNKSVLPTSWKSLLSALGFQDSLAFNLSIKIRKNFEYKFQADEKLGQPISAVSVLSKYSDEPDWWMDKELFDADQYPELWNPDLAMMGGKTGTPSQAFRHMYWPPFSWLSPLQTFKLPFHTLFHGNGEAPERFKIFIELSRKAKAANQTYWALRFLANALHYVEDLGQPYHTTQTPSKHWAIDPFLNSKYGQGKKQYIKQVTHLVSYYHFSFEDFLAEKMRENPPSPLATHAFEMIEKDSKMTFFFYDPAQPSSFAQNVAVSSNHLSSQAAIASIGLFPELSEPWDSVEPKKFMNESWWNEVKKRAASPTPEQAKALSQYEEAVSDALLRAGQAVREVVQAELASFL